MSKILVKASEGAKIEPKSRLRRLQTCCASCPRLRRKVLDTKCSAFEAKAFDAGAEVEKGGNAEGRNALDWAEALDQVCEGAEAEPVSTPKAAACEPAEADAKNLKVEDDGASKVESDL